MECSASTAVITALALMNLGIISVAYGLFWLRRKQPSIQAMGISSTMFQPLSLLLQIIAIFLLECPQLANCFVITTIIGAAHVLAAAIILVRTLRMTTLYQRKVFALRSARDSSLISSVGVARVKEQPTQGFYQQSYVLMKKYLLRESSITKICLISLLLGAVSMMVTAAALGGEHAANAAPQADCR
jgi:hypothetical protein